METPRVLEFNQAYEEKKISDLENKVIDLRTDLEKILEDFNTFEQNYQIFKGKKKLYLVGEIEDEKRKSDDQQEEDDLNNRRISLETRLKVFRDQVLTEIKNAIGLEGKGKSDEIIKKLEYINAEVKDLLNRL